MTLLVCRTCPRYAPQHSGEFAQSLTAALTTAPAVDKIDVRKVHCLGGCPNHGVVAIDGPGKARIRFAGLTAHDVQAIIEAALGHDACLTGAPEDWHVPESLADRISSITLKRAPRHAHSPSR
ncbi:MULTISPECIES: DUF1636 family protein [Prauserella salsuginis group]|uniref:DUF1636 family protein n=1 Tax=Prauserella salsuginis TaxID=387889 RepID=A0ABW6G0Y1_9PSEU|nr:MULTISPECIES: DUF1636 family protein [Prauserella salsuginis group]MCR3722012.1 Protein of unknown function (DUF1636) [Prauserella flava]MCR3736018.1 Protein of unknown function (DUF1636) [Prauserella salsuginis]